MSTGRIVDDADENEKHTRTQYTLSLAEGERGRRGRRIHEVYYVQRREQEWKWKNLTRGKKTQKGKKLTRIAGRARALSTDDDDASTTFCRLTWDSIFHIPQRRARTWIVVPEGATRAALRRYGPPFLRQVGATRRHQPTGSSEPWRGGEAAIGPGVWWEREQRGGKKARSLFLLWPTRGCPGRTKPKKGLDQRRRMTGAGPLPKRQAGALDKQREAKARRRPQRGGGGYASARGVRSQSARPGLVRQGKGPGMAERPKTVSASSLPIMTCRRGGLACCSAALSNKRVSRPHLRSQIRGTPPPPHPNPAAIQIPHIPRVSKQTCDEPHRPPPPSGLTVAWRRLHHGRLFGRLFRRTCARPRCGPPPTPVFYFSAGREFPRKPATMSLCSIRSLHVQAAEVGHEIGTRQSGRAGVLQ